MTSKRALRFLQLVVTGGVMFQLVGCAGGLAPAFLSLAESVVLEFFFSAIVPGI